MTKTEAKKRIIEVLRQKGLTMVLSTADAEGKPRSRFMGALNVGSGKTLYMATHAEARKVDQLRANGQCQVLASTPGWAEIVCVNGRAAMETSAAKKQAMWNAHSPLANYFSGPADPAFGLIRITLETGEYLSMQHAHQPVEVKF